MLLAFIIIVWFFFRVWVFVCPSSCDIRVHRLRSKEGAKLTKGLCYYNLLIIKKKIIRKRYAFDVKLEYSQFKYPIWLKRFQQIRYFFVWFSADGCYHHTNEFQFKGTIIIILIDSPEIRLNFFSLLNFLSSIVGVYLLLFVNIVAKILAVDLVFCELMIFKIWFIEFTFTKVAFTILNQIPRNRKIKKQTLKFIWITI